MNKIKSPKLSVELAKEIVGMWGKNSKLIHAILNVEGMCINYPKISSLFGVSKEDIDWDGLMCKHGIPEYTYINQYLDSYIAKYFVKANNCLIEGKKELAWKWIASGKDTPDPTRKWSTTEGKKETKKIFKNKIFVNARALDKTHDWNTCK